MPTLPKPPGPGSRILRPWYSFTRAHVVAYRWSKGRIGGKLGRAPILLLHHVGRKSGVKRVSPLLYLPDGDDMVVVASMGGSDKHPSWWINLRANPETIVEVGGEKRAVVAEQADTEEKARLWPRLVEMYPSYGTYQSRTSREIPVVILRRESAARATGNASRSGESAG
jgi:deazaflavin-dependent oxidoreductase (nitroreductase family)